MTTTTTPTIPALADCLLVRYLLKDTAPSKVRDDVRKLFPHAAVDDATLDLCAGGFLVQGKRNKMSLTPVGRTRALQFLGVEELPLRSTWATIVAQQLFPKATQLAPEAAAKLKSKEQLAAYLLKRRYELPAGSGTSMNQVLEALVCQQLGHPEETSLHGLLCAILSALVGSEERLTKDQLAKQVPLYQTGLKKGDATDIRFKLVREWLQTLPAPTQPPTPEPLDLGEFANTVLRLAKNSPPEARYQYAATKVFISQVWQASQAEVNFPRLTLPQFKDYLVQAHVGNLLTLSRADLVLDMDPQLVAASEIAHLNATYHFILLE